MDAFPSFKKERNKIRDLFKVKLFSIRSETKYVKREREKKRERKKREGEREREKKTERERDFKYLLTLILTGGSQVTLINPKEISRA